MTNTELQKRQEHLTLMTSPSVARLRQSSDVTRASYVDALDLGQSEKEKVKDLLVRIALDDQPIVFIHEFLTAIRMTSWSVTSIVRNALENVTTLLR